MPIYDGGLELGTVGWLGVENFSYSSFGGSETRFLPGKIKYMDRMSILTNISESEEMRIFLESFFKTCGQIRNCKSNALRVS